MIDRGRLLATFLALVRMESPSGREDELAQHLMGALRDLGLEATRDRAGNVLGRRDGNGPGTPFLLGAHMDTVTPCQGVSPLVKDGVVRAGGDTILGADDKSGIAQILEMIAVVEERGLPHPPIDVLFTVGEEVGLIGAKGLDTGKLRASWAVILDHDEIDEIVVRAPSHDRLKASVHGKAAHAGAKPEDGINAIRIAAEAVAAMPLGRIDAQTTANIGMIQGGGATNVVPALVELNGEARSRSEASLSSQVGAMRRALEEAAARHGGRVQIEVERSYTAYRRGPEDEVVRRLSDAIRSLGMTPKTTESGGGTDANILNARGLPAVVAGTGMRDGHSLDEHILVEDLVLGARLLVALATRAAG